MFYPSLGRRVNPGDSADPRQCSTLQNATQISDQAVRSNRCRAFAGLRNTENFNFELSH